MISPSASPLPTTGTLSEMSPVRLYYLAASTDQSKLLRFQLEDRAIEVQFKKGNPEHVSSSHAEDSVGEFLRAQKLVTAEQIAHAEAVLASFGNDLVSALFGLGILSPATAFARLAEQALGVLRKALAAERGAFEFKSVSMAPNKVMPLGNRWSVLTEIVRKIPAPEIKRRMNGVMDMPFFTSGNRAMMKELPLTPQETRAAAHIDGARTLNQLLKDFPLDGDNLVRLVFLFQEIEVLSFRGRSTGSDPVPPAQEPYRGSPSAPAVDSRRPAPARSETPRPAPPVLNGAAAKPAPAPAIMNKPPALSEQKKPVSAPAGDSAAASAKELDQLRAKAGRIKDENYFQMLGVSENADAGAIKLGYIKLAKLYHPDTLSIHASPEVDKLKADIFTSVGEAYRVLSDDRSRANYLEILNNGGSEDLLPLAQVLVAEETFQRGCNLVKAKRFGEAVKVLDDAIRGNPDEGEFYAWRGYAKFFSMEDKREGNIQAQKDLQLALKKSEKCAPAHYFLGHIAKLGGDKRVALKHFRLAVEIRPDYIEAKREVRMLTTKK